MKVRIGIDVGGSFTDAVAINHDTYELIGKLKIPTTHDSQEGVAKGIILALKGILEEYSIKPNEVIFIAHGTTQATNALLEGDVVKVGVITAAKGLEGIKAKNDTNIGVIELAPNKFLYTENEFVDLNKNENYLEAIENLVSKGCKAIVASSPFAVDNPKIEEAICLEASNLKVPSTATNEISKLYGLRVRTRTAVINASILPKMMETANMTESSIIKTNIEAPLMIMRGDGGVMNINEVRRRPILTMLSGPAAGVAGALMYEKVSNGLFLEVGGTSTDISVIKNGRIVVENSEIGGHKTFLNALDVRTVGIAGGSMVRFEKDKISDVGPRSAHIAGLPYAVFAKESEIIEPKIVTFAPKESDPDDYCAIECSNGKKFALTVSCAANVLGYVPQTSYAYGNAQSARKAFRPLAEKLNLTVEDVATKILELATEKVRVVISQMIKEYDLGIEHLILVGGGGGSASIVPYLAHNMNLQYKISKNAEVISPIGVALAMVRDVVERIILNPTKEDIISIRKEVEQSVIISGATPESVEVHIEIDTTKNIVRAIGTGTTELRTKDLTTNILNIVEIETILKESFSTNLRSVDIKYDNGFLYFAIIQIVTKILGVFNKKENIAVVIDNEGIIRMRRPSGKFYNVSTKNAINTLTILIDENTVATDGGIELPMMYLFLGKKIVDLSGLIDLEQILSMVELEIQSMKDDSFFILLSERGS